MNVLVVLGVLIGTIGLLGVYGALQESKHGDKEAPVALGLPGLGMIALGVILLLIGLSL